jgi:hypothetical protein
MEKLSPVDSSIYIAMYKGEKRYTSLGDFSDMMFELINSGAKKSNISQMVFSLLFGVRTDEPIDHNVMSFIETTIDTFKKMSKHVKAEFDLHEQNIMMRGQTLVILDPAFTADDNNFNKWLQGLEADQDHIIVGPDRS